MRNAISKAEVDSDILRAALFEEVAHLKALLNDSTSNAIFPPNMGSEIRVAQVDIERNPTLNRLVNEINKQGGTNISCDVAMRSSGYVDSRIFASFTLQSRTRSSLYSVQVRVFLDGEYAEFVKPTLNLVSEHDGVHWVCEQMWIHYTAAR